ncbi:putative oxidoreductase CzcO [Nocardioides baekrokdamisoli]|uniref:Putative oxidoreductase CzcO n=1 Tax=Nocardioides baekrokdamisoli TaxID=1804624 RepID=A0A3G9IBS4_9ACTN|nr:NAD(P)/FAD-dependent oxidoreductase [Nocardioides baekrokdamisoli]BBH15726.1 putative oxidoreductase CzcO [Nocardioides baekrokdamisoli]
MNEHIETVIIGGGQAGLSTGHHLKQMGRPFVILDSNGRLGDQWRRHYDSLVLFTPRKYDGLPGLPFPGEPTGFPRRDEVAAYIEAYALHHELPVRTNTAVTGVTRREDGTFLVSIEGGDLTCDNVVVAVGKASQPRVPSFAADLDPAITQLHSSAYRSVSDVPAGRVLVVGASHSGADIAYELAATHPVTLSGRDTGQIPGRPEDPRSQRIFPVMLWTWNHVLTRRTPMGRKVMKAMRAHGAPLLRTKAPDLAGVGVERTTERVVEVRDGRPVLSDGTVIEATSVVWATGFGHSFGWIEDLPLAADGWPAEYRGEVAAVPGLYFCGLIFQYAFSSMVFPGIGRDAQYVADRIAARARATESKAAEPLVGLRA